MKICGPCYKCERRMPLCHSICKEYLDDKQAKADKADMIRKAKEDENAVREVRQRSFEKHQSKKHGG